MSTVPLFYAGGGRAKIVGPATKQIYWFPQGEPIEVDSGDADVLLTKTKTTECCGGEGRMVTTKLFERA